MAAMNLQSSSSVEDPPADVINSGWMMKQGHIIRNWKKRFFVIQPAASVVANNRRTYHLLYYKDRNYEDVPPTGAIDLYQATLRREEASPANMFGLRVTTSKGKGYPFRCESVEDRVTWNTAISEAITNAVVDSTNNSASASADSSSQAETQRPMFAAEIVGNQKSKPKRMSVVPKNMSSQIGITDFDLLKVIGKGAFGKVYLVKKRDGEGKNKLYAMKVLEKSTIKKKGQEVHTKSERNILHEIQHPFIVYLYYAFQTNRKLYMVTDYFPGNNLFAHIQQSRIQGGFAEPRARFYSAELCCALDFLHINNIVYRDLKLENILMDMDGHIVLTDFGLSKDQVADVTQPTMKTFCGTVEYMAPELVSGQTYSSAVDWWSYGVLVFEMLTTRTPFFSKNGRSEIFQNIKKRDVKFPADKISPEARAFITHLLDKVPQRRLGMGAAGAAPIYEHAWFAKSIGQHAGIDFEALLKKEITPPWTPDIKGQTDFKYVSNRLKDQVARDSEHAQGAAQDVEKKNKWDEFTFVGRTLDEPES